MMRVALVTPEFPGCGPAFGVGAYVRTLAGALRAAGCAVLVLVAGDEGRWRLEDRVQPLGGGRIPFALRPAWRRAWLRTELDRWRPDVVEAPNWGGLGATLRGPWRLAVRLSTPTRLIRQPGPVRRALRPVHHAWEAAAVRAADLVIADSAAMAAVGERVYRRASDAVIPHAWDGPIAAAPSTGRDLLFVGRLEHRKGIDVLLRAWARVRGDLPDRTLHLVGADPDGFGATCLRRFGADGVAVHGRLDDAALTALRTRCAVQAVPSRFESFGLVVLEAWAAGLAVVATDGGALPEVVGGVGDVVPLVAGALAAALRHRLADPAPLAEAGLRRLRTRHAPERLAADTLATYGRQRAAVAPGHR